jgi:arylsulfatase A-like enzyme
VRPGDRPTLAARARDAGQATGAVVASDILRPHAGFGRGFQSYAHVPYSNARQVNDLAGAFLENHVGQQFLLFLHYFDPHGPYNAPGEWRDRYVEPALRGLTVAGAEARWKAAMQAGTPPAQDDPDMRFLYQRYLGEIAWFDHQLGELLAGLERLDLLDSTIVVLTADHGEEFMEHGGWWHGTTLYEEQIHVPLLVKWPKGKVGAPARVDDHPVRHIDIVPTLLTQAGAPIPAAMQGIDLAVPMAQRSEADRMVYAEEDHEGNVLRSIRTSEWKLIEANPGNPRGLPDLELFAIGQDPKETQDVAPQNAPVTAEMRQHAEAQRQLAASQAVEGGEQAKLTREECEKLRVLGYVQDCDSVN